jgi:putative restriction endonuclease
VGKKEVDFLEHDKVRIEPGSKLVSPTGPTEITSSVKVRRGQQFFRQAILSAYGVRCCISGINVPRLLVASHIKPWSDFPNDRLKTRLKQGPPEGADAGRNFCFSPSYIRKELIFTRH